MKYIDTFIEWLTVFLSLDMLLKIIFSVITLIIAVILNKFTSYSIKKVLEEKISKETVKQLLQIKSYLIYGLALIVLLGIFGVNPTVLATTFGFLGFAIGFAARDIISNFLAGVLIILERSFSINDIVQIKETVGRVKIIKLRSTQIVTFDGNLVTIPNSTIFSSEVINMTAGSDLMQSAVWAKVAYEADIEKVKKLMKEAANHVEGAYVNGKEYQPLFELKEVDDQWGIRIEMLFYLKARNEPWIRSRVQEKVMDKLVEHDIPLHTLASRPSK